MLICEDCEVLLADAVYADIEEPQRSRLQQHLDQCQACRQLKAEMEMATTLLSANGLAADRYDDIPERVGMDALWDSLQPALDQADAERFRHRPRIHIAPYLTGALAMAASLLLFIFVFDISVQTGEPVEQVAQTPAERQASNAELMNYLRRAETMLMTVANAESRNTSGVPFRQGFARNMAQEAGYMTTNMDERINSGQTRLLKDIEYMLMQIANLDEGNMDEGVRLLQRYIEDNSILFRIRLLEMRESENVI